MSPQYAYQISSRTGRRHSGIDRFDHLGLEEPVDFGDQGDDFNQGWGAEENGKNNVPAPPPMGPMPLQAPRPQLPMMPEGTLWDAFATVAKQFVMNVGCMKCCLPVGKSRDIPKCKEAIATLRRRGYSFVEFFDGTASGIEGQTGDSAELKAISEAWKLAKKFKAPPCYKVGVESVTAVNSVVSSLPVGIF